MQMGTAAIGRRADPPSGSEGRDSSLEIRLLRLSAGDDLTRFRGLLTHLLGAEPSEAWLRWKYAEHPWVVQHGINLVVGAFEGQRLAGVLPFVPLTMANGERSISVAKATNIIVAPQYQGRGVFGRLLRYAEGQLREIGFDLGLVYPNFNSYPGFLKNGWKDVGTNDSLFWMPSVPRLVWRRLSKQRRAPAAHPRPSALPRAECVTLSAETFPEYAAVLSDASLAVGSAGKFSLSTSPEYLQWRYVDKPGQRYFVHFHPGDGEPQGYMVFTRFVRQRRDEVYLVDVRCRDRRELRTMFARFLAGLDRSCDVLRYELLWDAGVYAELRTLGFVNREHWLLRRVIPQRRVMLKPFASNLQPLERRESWALSDCDQDIDH